MGRKSTIADNIYLSARENINLTREQASERMSFVSKDRIERIERGEALPHPDELLAMSEAYQDPYLCNQYCSNECPIGQQYVPEITIKDLSPIVLKLVDAIYNVDEQKRRIIAITADGELTDDEYADFAEIQTNLERLSIATEALQLWKENLEAKGRINPSKLEQALKQVKEYIR
jgi:transcriptional regulator with XRE-family HTH domain